MNLSELKINNKNSSYSILIGKNILHLLPIKLKKLCPNTRKIAIVSDNKVPNKFKLKIRKSLNSYKVFFYNYKSNEKLKSFKNIDTLVEKCIANKFNRSDTLIGLGGGIVGDFSAFAASIIKRGINFINIPTTLLAQVDSSIGGKTGVNSKYGKNLIGSFYQPKLVISDVNFLISLPKREMVCGFAEILKHSLIFDKKFFIWLKINSSKLLENKDLKVLQVAIYKSCKIKLHFVTRDFKEKNTRMTLNFGHTFAHAIEGVNRYSRKINHGEAVLIGMVMAMKLSNLKKLCSKETIAQVIDIYKKNKINHSLTKYFGKSYNNKIIEFMANDKKNNDSKVNFILLKRIGKTTNPDRYKLTIREIKKIFPKLI
jgi:3-dehydroquinate synthase